MLPIYMLASDLHRLNLPPSEPSLSDSEMQRPIIEHLSRYGDSLIRVSPAS